MSITSTITILHKYKYTSTILFQKYEIHKYFPVLDLISELEGDDGLIKFNNDVDNHIEKKDVDTHIRKTDVDTHNWAKSVDNYIRRTDVDNYNR